MPDLRRMAVLLTRHPCAVSAPGINGKSGGRYTQGYKRFLFEGVRSAGMRLRIFDSPPIQEAAVTMQMVVQKRHYGTISHDFASNTLYKTLNY